MMWRFPDDGLFFGDRRRFPDTGNPDVRLTYLVAEALLNDARTRHERVTVEVQNRVVLLGGVVAERSVQLAVRDIARAVPGVTDTCDSMRVIRDNAQESGVSDEDRFRSIVADLEAGKPYVDPSLGMPRIVTWAILAASTWALLTVLMVTSRWAAVAVTCALIGLVVTAVTRRRRRRGDERPPAER
jgi:hypothetical protein